MPSRHVLRSQRCDRLHELCGGHVLSHRSLDDMLWSPVWGRQVCPVCVCVAEWSSVRCKYDLHVMYRRQIRCCCGCHYLRHLQSRQMR